MPDAQDAEGDASVTASAVEVDAVVDAQPEENTDDVDTESFEKLPDAHPAPAGIEGTAVLPDLPPQSELDFAHWDFTDDRDDPDLFIFEKTWGHRLLAGCGFALFVVAGILIIYCALQIPSVMNFADTMGEYGQTIVTLGYVLYVTGIVAGVLVIPPAILAVYVATHPKRAPWAIGASLVAIVLVLLYVVYALSVGAAPVLNIALFSGLFALMPLVYLLASVKVFRSTRPEQPQGKHSL